MSNEQDILRLSAGAAIDKKAGDIEILKVSGAHALSDYFLICTGTSVTHVKALSDIIEKTVKQELNAVPRHIEGYSSGNWILLDYGSVLIHIFSAETRRFYSIERLWTDAPRIDPYELTGKEPVLPTV